MFCWELYFVVVEKLCFQRVFSISQHLILQFLSCCVVFDWLLYLYVWSAILGATLYIKNDEKTEDWLKNGA